ncbi:hypothetical protein OH76DRAFT_1423694 [Lentinus brumalis]|uniref:Uncharacterized protein n=1 Tax=Lentinus brumalis TaxID=2498619 RepID=A0A371CJH0_9APHY|nr:hypothetical protein OH76DRAFT_1423694 [Polyporus brumalis]
MSISDGFVFGGTKASATWQFASAPAFQHASLPAPTIPGLHSISIITLLPKWVYADWDKASEEILLQGLKEAVTEAKTGDNNFQPEVYSRFEHRGIDEKMATIDGSLAILDEWEQLGVILDLSIKDNMVAIEQLLHPLSPRQDGAVIRLRIKTVRGVFYGSQGCSNSYNYNSSQYNTSMMVH